MLTNSNYGTPAGIDDSANLVNALIDGGTTRLVNYSYLGLGPAVQATYPQPSLQYTLLDSSSGNNPVTGDIYWGLDLFGRIVDSRWFNTGTNADVDRIGYGYDQNSNRIWRQNPVATALSAAFDEYYTNDGLDRLKDMQRGTLNGTETGITSPTFAQCWTLDPTGNWMGFNEAASGGSWTLSQTRAANPVNEITGITTTTGSAWAAPAYDAAGNMTSIPEPASPEDLYTGTYDAWNRLVQLVDASSGHTVQENQYDARNFRAVILSYTGGTLSETRHCYYTSSWQDVEERVGTSTTADRQFVWGVRYIDDLVLRDTVSGRLYALQDANWNVASISDTTGSVKERYAYAAYGAPTFLNASFEIISASAYSWDILHSGYRYDASTGLYVVRLRFLQPYLGGWLTQDPLGYESDTNLRSYVNGSPLSAVDPFGLKATPFNGDDQKRLDYIRCIMKRLAQVLSTYNNNISKYGKSSNAALNNMWTQLYEAELKRTQGYAQRYVPRSGTNKRLPSPAYADALQEALSYSAGEYTKATSSWISFSGGTVNIGSGTTQNLPGWPGLFIARDTFEGSDYGALETLMHEAQHDWSKEGFEWPAQGSSSHGPHWDGTPSRIVVLEQLLEDLWDWAGSQVDPNTVILGDAQRQGPRGYPPPTTFQDAIRQSCEKEVDKCSGKTYLPNK